MRYKVVKSTILSLIVVKQSSMRDSASLLTVRSIQADIADNGLFLPPEKGLSSEGNDHPDGRQ